MREGRPIIIANSDFEGTKATPPPPIGEGGSQGEREEIPGAGKQHEQDLIGESDKEEMGGSSIRLAGGVGGNREGRE